MNASARAKRQWSPRSLRYQTAWVFVFSSAGKHIICQSRDNGVPPLGSSPSQAALLAGCLFFLCFPLKIALNALAFRDILAICRKANSYIYFRTYTLYGDLKGFGIYDRHGRYGLGPHQRGPGIHHDPRPRVLLRRHGPQQECAHDHHAELLHRGDDFGGVDDSRLHDDVRHGCGWLHRQPREVRARKCRPQRARGRHDSGTRVRRVPVHVRRHHAGAHHGSVCRAREVPRVHAVHPALGDPDLQPDGTLGLGRRLPRGARCARLRVSRASRSAC